MDSSPLDLRSVLHMARVVPVLVLDDVRRSIPLAMTLVAGGLPVIEVTLRTANALAVIRELSAIEGCQVGAGTVLNQTQAELAMGAGAKFLVSPGSTPELLDAVSRLGIPFLPGVATVSEAMAVRDRGITFAKFFPAEQAGGTRYLKALASPLSEMSFCPTGGINQSNAGDYLKLPNVVCVGGSWVAPDSLVAAGDWAGIERLAKSTGGYRELNDSGSETSGMSRHLIDRV